MKAASMNSVSKSIFNMDLLNSLKYMANDTKIKKQWLEVMLFQNRTWHFVEYLHVMFIFKLINYILEEISIYSKIDWKVQFP